MYNLYLAHDEDLSQDLIQILTVTHSTYRVSRLRTLSTLGSARGQGPWTYFARLVIKAR